MAERLGLPVEVVADARSRREQKEAQAEALLKRLEDEKAQLERAAERLGDEQRALERSEAGLRARERETEGRKRSELEAFRRELARRGEEAARKAVDAIQQAVQRVEAARRSAASAGEKARGQALAALKQAQQEATDPQALGLPAEPESAALPLAVGARVRVRDLGVVGEVMSLTDHDAEVAVGGKRLRAPREALSVVAVAAPPRLAASRVSGSAVRVKSAGQVAGEINLVGRTVDEALPLVDKLLDDAALAERKQIRVIHGFGAGRLRQAVAGLLQGHPHVATYRLGASNEGGGGVTIVELKD
jgi:DNA mismatch repair protein MutS2